MLHLTPKAYGSLGHDESSHQKKTTVTKFKGAHLLKWLAAVFVLEGVGAATVPWSAELVASGSNSTVSQHSGRALGEEQRSCFEQPGSCFEQKTWTTDEVYLPFQFCKTMPHSNLGMCRKEDVDKLTSLTIRPSYEDLTLGDLETIPQATTSARPFENPFADLGSSPAPFVVSPAKITSKKQLFGMVETWAMAVLRDVPFSDWPKGPSSLTPFIDFLNTLEHAAPTDAQGKITFDTVFRGAGVDEDKGSYVSQYLLLPFDYGGLSVEQKYRVEDDAAPSVTRDGWHAIQRGEVLAVSLPPPPRAPENEPPAQYTSSMRVLGSMVHNDPLYQFYYNAVLISLGCGVEAVGLEMLAPAGSGARGVPRPKITAWTDGGVPDVLAAVAHVARGALQTAWFHKWNVQMRIRPEVLAQRFNICSERPHICADMGLKEGYDLIPQNVKDLISQHNCELQNNHDCKKENLYLALQYPEGSPTHPSWPSGHAVVAGACVTVIKAMLATVDPDGSRKPWPKKCPAMMAKADGSELIADSSAEKEKVTIVGELHKLASNVALGRNMAGVHYRTDGDEGILLGEAYALTYLQENLRETVALQALHNSFRLSKFDGSVVRITADAVSSFFSTKAKLKTAVQAYNDDPTAATATYGPIADWDVSAITDMNGLFKNMRNINEDISKWDTSGVTNMNSMFFGASAFNQPLSFDTSSVTDMSFMFEEASAFNKPLSFETSSVITMYSMFYDAPAFNQPLSFKTSSVKDMSWMFARAGRGSAFNQALSFDTSSVTNMEYMFYGNLGRLI